MKLSQPAIHSPRTVWSTRLIIHTRFRRQPNVPTGSVASGRRSLRELVRTNQGTRTYVRARELQQPTFGSRIILSKAEGEKKIIPGTVCMPCSGTPIFISSDWAKESTVDCCVANRQGQALASKALWTALCATRTCSKCATVTAEVRLRSGWGRKTNYAVAILQYHRYNVYDTHL